MRKVQITSCCKHWSGRPDLNRRPPAPKAGVLSFGSPSFSILSLKANELEKYLVVARCTEMCLRMRRVPRIFPIAKPRRNCDSASNPQSDYDRSGHFLAGESAMPIASSVQEKKVLSLPKARRMSSTKFAPRDLFIDALHARRKMPLSN